MKLRIRLQRVFIILFFCLSPAVTYGQAALIILILGDKVASEKLYLSIDGGTNLSSLPGLDEGKIKVGFNYGIGLHIKLSDHWQIRPEFRPLSSKGAKELKIISAIPGEIIPDRTTLKLNYIETPIIIQYNLNNAIYFSAGPQISFLTVAKQITSGSLNNQREVEIDLDVKSLVKTIDFGIPVELGYSTRLSTKKSTSKVDFNIYLRYCYGLVEIFRETTNKATRNSLFQVGISLPFINSPESRKQEKRVRNTGC